MSERVLNTNSDIGNTEYLVTLEQRELLIKIRKWMPKSYELWSLVHRTINSKTYGKIHIKGLNQAREEYLKAMSK